MKFLEVPIRKREFVAEGEGSEEYPEAKQPPLPSDKSSRAAKGPQLEIRRECGGRDLGEILGPLKTNPLRKLGVLLHIFFDESACGWTRLTRKIHRDRKS